MSETVYPGLPQRPDPLATPIYLAYIDAEDQTIEAGTVHYVVNLDPENAITDLYQGYTLSTPAVYQVNPILLDAHLTNNGTIWSKAEYHNSLAVWADNLTNTGLIVSETLYDLEAYNGNRQIREAYGVIFNGTITNSGEIHAFTPTNNAIAIKTEGFEAAMTNSGFIGAFAQVGYDEPETSGGARAVWAVNQLALVNEAGGHILAEGETFVAAVDIGRGFYRPGESVPDAVINYGLIEAVSLDPNVRSIGVSMNNLTIETMVLQNFGTIRADDAIIHRQSSSVLATLLASTQTIINHDEGLVEGDVSLGFGEDVLTNSGLIIGTVDLGTGDDTVTNTGAVQGTILLGDGNDMLTAGGHSDLARGGWGDDTLIGGGGRDLLIGDGGQDFLEGGRAADGLFGGSGNDQLITEAGDIAHGGLGDDILTTLDLTFAELNGGDGHDIWAMALDGVTLDLRTIDKARLKSLEELQLGADQSVVISADTVRDLSSTDTLTLSGTSSGTVFLEGNWAEQAESGIVGYTAYQSGEFTLLVADALAVSTDAANATGLDDIATPGRALLPPSDTDMALLADDRIIEAYAIVDDFVIDSGLTLRYADGGQMFTSANALFDPNVTNYGTVIATATGETSARALDLYSFRLATNEGRVEAHTDGTGLALGMSSGLFGVIHNKSAGEVVVSTTEGVAVGLQSLVFDASWLNQVSAAAPSGPQGFVGLGAGTVNDGFVSASSGTGLAIGMYGSRNSIGLQNTGTIEAISNQGIAIGVWAPTGSNIINEGTIRAVSGSKSDFLSVGIDTGESGLGDLATVDNRGVIEADIALFLRTNFLGGGAPIIVSNSGTMTGEIRFDASRETPEEINYTPIFLTNSGTMNGHANFSDADQTVAITNTGTISGDYLLGAGSDTFAGAGGTYDGILIAGAGDDAINAGAGNAFIVIGLGANTVDGGAGFDTLAFLDAVAGVTGNLASGVFSTGDRASGFEAFVGSNFNDNFKGTGRSDLISGASGDDIISGKQGNDEIYGDGGNDTLNGNAGDDLIYGGEGNDKITGSDGVDTLYGEAGRDNIIGGAGDDLIYGGDGDDVLNGRGDSDLVYGGLGNDVVTGGFGIDTLYGDDGNDSLIGKRGDDLMFGGAGNDRMIGGGENDTAHGGDGNDRLFGSGGNDILNGDAGRDSLNGGGGDDQLNGGLGDDTLGGKSGVDILNGGLGADNLSGGTGLDQFVFAMGDSLLGAEDTIFDLERGETLALSAHTFIGDSAFTAGGSREVRYEATATSLFVEIDNDGDGITDERIDFNNITQAFAFTSDGAILTAAGASVSEGLI